MDTLTTLKTNNMRSESQRRLRTAKKSLGLGHSDVKRIIAKLDEDLLSARSYWEVQRLSEFTDNLITYLNLL